MSGPVPPPLVLAVDTATPQVGVALAGPDGPLAALQVVEGRRHGEVLAPAVEEVCRLAGVTLRDVGLFAVDVGPGLFTGLRVGLATVAALAHGLGRPALGVTSTELLTAAHPAAADTAAGRPVAAVVDIRRGDVAWSLTLPGRPPAAPVVATPDELAAALRDGPAGVLAVGDGARRYAAVLHAAGTEVAGAAWAHPSAVVLADLAVGRAGQAGDAGALAPVYLRDADVRIGWQQAPARG
ncbi:MAG TPA: tRNA (adenosine(37)-N6)-threonylcarbamoyltransferase complex dimerization subunit type 1 TsaB [Acidimicrobiales bacterium]|nr:tRNA (adenosine(37)-N6)-threonylcarbamoyltransferase complex dimerization subunit type 1 TsaB [Acidimicrobiales bacterium]